MKKKLNLLTLVIFSFLIAFCFGNINLVKSAGPITIRSDGSVIGTDNLLREGNIYTFVGDIQGSINIENE